MADQSLTALLAAHNVSVLDDLDPIGPVDDLSAGVTGATTLAAIRAGVLLEASVRSALRFVEKIAPAATGVAATDTANLQAFLASLTDGDKALFGPGEWLINAGLQYPQNVYYEGTSSRTSVGTRIKQANGANLDALMASAVWYSASATPTSATWVHWRNFVFDGNKTNQTAGLGYAFVTMNFQSTFEHLEMVSARGSGMHATSETLAGNGITNTCNEIYINRCQFRGCDGHGFELNEHSAASLLTDGWIQNCISAGNAGDGFRFDAMAGWVCHNNHGYGNAKNGIAAYRMFRTRLTNNYIESFGDSTSAGTYVGINAYTGFTNTGQSIIAFNTVHDTRTDVAANTRGGLWIEASTGAAVRMSIIGNNIIGQAGATIATTGFRVQCQDSSGSILAQVVGNYVVAWNTDCVVNVTGTIKVAGDTTNIFQSTGALTFSATPAYSSALAALRGGLVQMTLTANVTSATMTDGVDGQEVSFVLTQDATGGRTIAWPSNFDNPPASVTTASGVTAGTFKFIGATSRWRRF